MYALHLNIYVTDICNRKCSYCYNPYNNMGNMEMSVAKDIGNWVGKATHDARVKNFRCHFLGGEPFINLNSVFTIIEIIDNNYNIPASSDGKYVIFTNGDYLTDQNLRELKNRKVLIYLHCLEDLPINELEKRILLVKNIHHGCALSIVIDESPLDRFREIIKLAIKHKCHPRMNALYKVNPEYVSEYKKIYREKIRLALDLIYNSDFVVYPNFLQSDLYITWDKIGVNPHFCGKCFYVIDSVGKIRTCTIPDDSNRTEYSVYNCTTWKDINFVHKHKVDNDDCYSCKWVTWCQGGCPVRRKIAKVEKTYLCDIYKETFPIMFELKNRWENRRLCHVPI